MVDGRRISKSYVPYGIERSRHRHTCSYTVTLLISMRSQYVGSYMYDFILVPDSFCRVKQGLEGVSTRYIM